MRTQIFVRNLVVAAVLLVALVATAGCDTSSPAGQQSQSASIQPTMQTGTKPTAQANPTYAAPAPLRKADFGAWRYSAQKMGTDTIQPFGGKQINPGDVFAKVNYNSDTADGVRSYVAANRNQLQKVVNAGGQAEAWITFRNYVAPNDFRAWVKAHGLSNPQSQMRAIDETKDVSNKYITMQIGPRADDPDPLPQVYMNFYTGVQADHNPQAVMKAVYFTRASVDAKELPAIASDPNVYLVDVTPDLVRMDLAANGVQNADKADVEVEPVSPMYVMEKVGLDQFK